MKFARRFWPQVLLVLLVAAGITFWFQHDRILDWAVTRNYHPSAAVQGLANDTTMTAYGRELFYANRPAIEAKDDFNQHCTNLSDQVAVLGCFEGNRLGIYVFDVTDERLSGIEQVTAAHEMLHQAYQRLNSSERNYVDGLLQQYFDQGASQALKDKINSYKQSEPDQLQNEMHSIFGTEATNLPPELERYYAQYFANRSAVIALHQKYQSEFDQRLAQISSYDAQLGQLKSQIESDKTRLSQQEQVLRQQREQMDSYLSSGQVAKYNAGVSSFNNQVDGYRELVKETNKLVSDFNSILALRNSIAVQERQLEDAINSNVTTAPRQ
ncbi:MAG TPA: hypothetical protein VL737_01525 [Candidatus Pristimantibacillus sp.]|jgi:hypothetical protein|nr:hypothetical protein [Candidatus Pristimantibacillus sp.]